MADVDTAAPPSKVAPDMPDGRLRDASPPRDPPARGAARGRSRSLSRSPPPPARRSRSRERSPPPARRSRSRERSPPPARRSRSRERSPAPRRSRSRELSPRRDDYAERRRSGHDDRRRREEYYPDRSRGYDRRGGYGGGRDDYDRRRSYDRPPPRRSSPPPPPPVHRFRDREKVPESSVEADQRTVVCMQLSRKCTERDLSEFLEEGTGGRIVSCRMITDRHSGRPKGIAYAEFRDVESVAKALELSGQRLLRAPIIVMLTQSERNRQAAEKARIEKEALTRLAVSGLPAAMTADKHLRIAFEPFGKLRDCVLLRDEAGNPTGDGLVVFDSPTDAQKALEGMNEKEFLGSVLSVSLAAQSGIAAFTGDQAGLHPVLDNEAVDRGGVHMTAELRARLTERARTVLGVAEGAPTAPATTPAAVAPTASSSASGGVVVTPNGMALMAASPCLLLRNMFNPATETLPNWDQDLRDEVVEECAKYGDIYHVFVDKTAVDGTIYLKFADEAGALKSQAILNGRFFDGKQIQAIFLPLPVYEQRFPESVGATTPLQPSST